MAEICSIWDPNPMCKGSEQSAQSEDELANYRKRTASEKADDIFIKELKNDKLVFHPFLLITPTVCQSCQAGLTTGMLHYGNSTELLG